jgi:hypothetical protein
MTVPLARPAPDGLTTLARITATLEPSAMLAWCCNYFEPWLWSGPMPREPDLAKRRVWQRRLLQFERGNATIGEFCRRAGVRVSRLS